MKYLIPFKTPTVNHLYGYRMGNPGPYLKPEAKKLKERIKEIVMENYTLIEPQRLKVIVSIHENWLNKDGSVKRKDIANREKFLIDSVFDALQIDDKFIYEHRMVKVQSVREFAVIEIEKLEE